MSRPTVRAYTFSPSYSQSRWELPEFPTPAQLEAFLWIDLVAPPADYLSQLEAAWQIQFPTQVERTEIEASSRFHTEDRQKRIILRLGELAVADEGNGLSFIEQTLIIIDAPERIITLREKESKTFQDLVRKLKGSSYHRREPTKILLAILQQVVDTDADNVELLSQKVHRLSAAVRETSYQAQQAAVLKIQSFQELVIRIREGLFDTQRVLSLLIREEDLNEESREAIRILLKDISSLIDHTNFSFQRLEALQNTLLSLINLEQNRVIKIFTVITVAFMPPTLIASIYGMNFRFMPELDWRYGYLFAWLLIVGSSVVTLWYFRWKRWL